MASMNREALDSRARLMTTVPAEFPKSLFDAAPAACQAILGGHYQLDGGGVTYVLATPPQTLTDVQRGDILACTSAPNGIKRLDLSLSGNTAVIRLQFYNGNYLNRIAALCNAMVDPVLPHEAFPISGGHRLRAGSRDEQVRVHTVAYSNAEPRVLTLTIEPIGDYSTYTLTIDTSAFAGAVPAFAPVIDPLFGEIGFKFRPGCFNTNCAPEWDAAPAPVPQPVIDYMAKDYDSFRHTMMTAMATRIPGWEPTTEADLDQVLLELFSAAADELSDYQDRVMNEAYLTTARKRVSLARHARLMDYHIHQGNQASTWLVLESAQDAQPLAEFAVAPGVEVWAGPEKLFVTDEINYVYRLLNRIGIYTWSGAIPSLQAGATSADLLLSLNDTQLFTDQASAVAVQNLIRSGRVRHLVIQEWLNPRTGAEGGRDPGKRQLVTLLPGNEGATAMVDPVTVASGDPVWFVRVRWAQADALRNSYCFTVDCDGRAVENVSRFHGNVAHAVHGPWRTATFREPGTLLPPGQLYYERTQRWGALCLLPHPDLAYRDTPPGGDVPPLSTLEVMVTPPAGAAQRWREVPNLIHSDVDDPGGNHFVVETDEERLSTIRFGSGELGINGRELPENAVVVCRYQVGRGPDGNLGADMLVRHDPATIVSAPMGLALKGCWNPFGVTSGRAPEPAAEIVRRAPEAYRSRQLRAVTLRDYVKRAEEVVGVSRAAARYAWTGSWRTVQVTVDPAGTPELDDTLRSDVLRHLETVRLIGEDLEIRPPRFVPLEIAVKLCIHADYWPEDVRSILEQEFSDGWTPDGRQGFFHPDRWSFGQPLRASQIVGRVEAIEGVDHVIEVKMRRWNGSSVGSDGVTDLAGDEIIEVMNDPDHMERGFIDFDIRGGRR